MGNDAVDDWDEAASAYDELIQAGDRVRLTPDEIREIAAALNGLPAGKSFVVTVKTKAEPAYGRLVAVDYD
jgi:hypothetical protein